MRIIHCSDQHGTLNTLPSGGDVVVCTGDFMPNASWGDREIEPTFQQLWIEKNIEFLKRWIGDRKFLLCLGNHDFFRGACEIMCDNGMDATDITNKMYEFGSLKFYGFPFIPIIEGHWNFELTVTEMNVEVNRLKEKLIEGVDILCAHCPMSGFLAECWGNTQMTNLFWYNLEEQYYPKAYLTGHVHSSFGCTTIGKMLYSNAATTCNVLEI